MRIWFARYESSSISWWVRSSWPEKMELPRETIGEESLLRSLLLAEYTLKIAGSISKILFFKLGVDRGVILPSFERRLLVELLLELTGVLLPLGLLDGFLFWTPYSSETVSEMISCCLMAGEGSIRDVPRISRWPLEELYFSLVSGTS